MNSDKKTKPETKRLYLGPNGARYLEPDEPNPPNTTEFLFTMRDYIKKDAE